MTKTTTPPSRIASIDIMRGMVIMLMMLDHVRERLYMHVRTGDPIYDTVEQELFFTRVLTHFCAPIFIVLAGVSAWLTAHPRSGTPRPVSGFLFKRGLVIIMIELVLYYLLWADSFPNYVFLQVLWAIGLSLIGLSVITLLLTTLFPASRLAHWVIGALGLVIVCGHNGLAFIDFEPGEWGYIAWTILHDPGPLGQIGPLTISLSYPVLPWFGVMLLGYFAGPVFAGTTDTTTRRRVLLAAGLGCLCLLGVLRGFNIYGESLPWAVQDTLVASVRSFINFTKYPPSLDYILFTLGVGALVMAWLDGVRHRNIVLRTMETFGSVPMFVYVLHLYIILAAYWLAYWLFGANQSVTSKYGSFERFGLDGVVWIWVGAVLLIGVHIPIARWFSAYKHREKRAKPWLSYF